MTAGSGEHQTARGQVEISLVFYLRHLRAVAVSHMRVMHVTQYKPTDVLPSVCHDISESETSNDDDNKSGASSSGYYIFYY